MNLESLENGAYPDPYIVGLFLCLTYLWATPVSAQHEAHSPYAGAGSEEVKTLTAEEVGELLAGEGMGLARVLNNAELNDLVIQARGTSSTSPTRSP